MVEASRVLALAIASVGDSDLSSEVVASFDPVSFFDVIETDGAVGMLVLSDCATECIFRRDWGGGRKPPAGLIEVFADGKPPVCLADVFAGGRFPVGLSAVFVRGKPPAALAKGFAGGKSLVGLSIAEVVWINGLRPEKCALPS